MVPKNPELEWSLVCGLMLKQQYSDPKHKG